MRKQWRSLALAGLPLLWCLTAGPATAEERAITLTSNDVVTHTTEDEAFGAYYTVEFEVPSLPEGTWLDHAVLELYVDVGSKARDEYVNDTPVLEVFALTSDFDGDFNPAEWDAETRVTRPLLLGEEKHVVMDITPIIRSFLATPSQNHGLVIGSLTGMREGDFTVLTGVFPEGEVMRVMLFYEPEETIHVAE